MVLSEPDGRVFEDEFEQRGEQAMYEVALLVALAEREAFEVEVGEEGDEGGDDDD